MPWGSRAKRRARNAEAARRALDERLARAQAEREERAEMARVPLFTTDGRLYFSHLAALNEHYAKEAKRAQAHAAEGTRAAQLQKVRSAFAARWCCTADTLHGGGGGDSNARSRIGRTKLPASAS